MKPKALIVKFLLVLSFLFVSIGANAQSEIVNFLQGGIADSESLMQAYLEPLGNAMGANLNSGWYNTAKVHNTLGFDITLTVTAAFPPETAKTFDLSKIGLQNLEPKDPARTIAPTFAGSRNKGPVLVVKNPVSGAALLEFESISGLDVPLYPLPMIKGAVGLPRGFEIMGRFIPRYSFEDISLGLWGAGIKYDFLQHIPAVNKVPFLNASIMGAYTSLFSSAAVNFQKSIYEAHAPNTIIVGGRENYENQEIEINMKGFTGMLLVSYDLPIITLYGGMGYSRAMTNVDLLGDYPVINTIELDLNSGQEVVRLDDVNNPISLSFDNFSGFQSTLGLRLKLAVVTLHVDYTLANYNMLSAGLGFSFR